MNETITHHNSDDRDCVHFGSLRAAGYLETILPRELLERLWSQARQYSFQLGNQHEEDVFMELVLIALSYIERGLPVPKYSVFAGKVIGYFERGKSIDRPFSGHRKNRMMRSESLYDRDNGDGEFASNDSNLMVLTDPSLACDLRDGCAEPQHTANDATTWVKSTKRWTAMGLSERIIAKRLGCAPSTAHVLRRNGGRGRNVGLRGGVRAGAGFEQRRVALLERHRDVATPDQLRIVELMKNHTRDQIVRMMGRSRSAISLALTALRRGKPYTFQLRSGGA